VNIHSIKNIFLKTKTDTTKAQTVCPAHLTTKAQTVCPAHLTTKAQTVCPAH
jgi:hypothetical protein